MPFPWCFTVVYCFFRWLLFICLLTCSTYSRSLCWQFLEKVNSSKIGKFWLSCSFDDTGFNSMIAGDTWAVCTMLGGIWVVHLCLYCANQSWGVFLSCTWLIFAGQLLIFRLLFFASLYGFFFSLPSPPSLLEANIA